MLSNTHSLAELPVGQRCRVTALTSSGAGRRRILDLGIVPGTEIEAVLKSLSGGITAYLIRGALIAIRKEDAVNIIVSNIII